MVGAIQAHIGSLNWGYRVALREKKVEYINAFAEFVDPHTLKVSLFNTCDGLFVISIFFFFFFFFRQLIRDKRKKPSRPNTSFLRLVVARVIPTFQVLKSLASHQMIFFRYLITRVKLCSSVPLTSRLNALDFLRVLVLTPLSW
jgi:hypothetical protein